MDVMGYGIARHWLCAFYRREVLRLSQCEVEYLTGVKKPNISNFELGRKNSNKIIQAYKDMGLDIWLRTLTKDRAAMLWELYTGAYACRTDEIQRGCCPLRMDKEGYRNGTED